MSSARSHRTALALVLLAPALLSCASGLQPTEFANPRFDFGFLERVAVIPFENLSSDQQAGMRVTRLLITELLASGAVDVVEPGEVQAALGRLGAGRTNTPNAQQVLALGRDLGVQAVIIGTVAQSEVLRSGAVGIPVVSVDAQMLETDTGAIVWAATHTEKGGGFGARVLGTGGEPIAETTRRCVRALLDTLVE